MNEKKKEESNISFLIKEFTNNLFRDIRLSQKIINIGLLLFSIRWPSAGSFTSANNFLHNTLFFRLIHACT